MPYHARGFTGLGVLLALTLVPATALADKKAKAEREPIGATSKAEGGDAKAAERPLPLAFDGLRWGMTRRQLEECVERKIEADSVALRKQARSTPALRDVAAQVAAQKAAFRRSYLELNEGPDGFDSSPLAGEFSKGNGEALMRLPSAGGGHIWFFLIGDRFWKTYEEVPQGKGAARGATLEEVSKRVRTSSGRAPKVSPAAPAKGRPATVYEWEDGATHLRLWDRDSGAVALVHEERAVLARLPAMRKKVAQARPTEEESLSPQVSAVLREVEKKPPPKPPTAKKAAKR